MSLHAKPIANLDGQWINLADSDGAVRAVSERLKARRGFTLFTLNLDHMVKRRSDPAFAAAYARASFVTADGAPVAALARSQGAKVERTPGADLVTPLCVEAERQSVPVFLFGSDKKTLATAAERLKAAFPYLRVAGCEAPPMGFDPTSSVALSCGERIAASGARLCFVALGAPKQEIFSDRMAQLHPQIGFVCIGASLDFIAGSQTRAPHFLQSVGLEWAWRLASNPRRLAARYARCAVLLTELVLDRSIRRKTPAGRGA